MQSKLEELARKEEELRRLNEALDIRKHEIMKDPSLDASPAASGDEGSDADSDDQFKGKNLAREYRGAADSKPEEEEDDYGDGNFENDTVGNTGKSSKQKPAAAFKSGKIPTFEMKMEDDDDIAAAVYAGKRAAASAYAENDDEELKSGMYEELKRKYEHLLSEGREQDKTINFQKAKIAALQTELEESL